MNDFNEKKISKTVDKVLELLTKQKLNIRELIVMYGNLGYHIGASISGFQGKGPDLETLEKAYYLTPTIDIGLMLQGLIITSWEEDFVKKPIISDLANKLKQKEEEK